MKKIILSLAVITVLAMSVLVGCGASAPDTLEDTTWKATTVKHDGKDYDVDTILSANFPNDPSVSEGITVTFHDGKATLNVMGKENKADYTYENGTLTVEGQTVKVSDESFTLSVDGMAMTMTKK